MSDESKDLASITHESVIDSSGTSIQDEEESKPPSPRRSSSFDNPKLTPFKLRWSYGVNPRVPIVNLTSDNRSLIAFACSHATSIYDYTSRDMHLLQGHQNYVSTMSTDAEGKWLLTADAGAESVVIIWDTESRLPICTLFNPHGVEELLTAKISPDAKYVVTVGNETEIRVNLWMWSLGRDESDASTALTGFGSDRVKEIIFNIDCPNHFLLGFDNNIVFVVWANGTLSWTRAKINENIERLGTLNVSTYVRDGHQALTGTSNGHVLVWSDVLYRESSEIKQDVSNNKKHVKSLHLQSSGITAIVNHSDVVIVGNALGHLMFYDRQLKLIFSCQKFGLDEINSISFHLSSHRRAPEKVVSESLVASTTSDLDYIIDSEDDTEEEEEVDIDENQKKEATLMPRRSKYMIERGEKFANLNSNVTISADLGSEIQPESNQDGPEVQAMGKRPDNVPLDYTLKRNPFCVEDFIVSTVTSRIARIEIRRLKCHFILHQSEAAVTALDTHPDRDLFVTGNMVGRISLYEYNNHHLLVSKQTPALPSFEELIARDVTGSITDHVTCPQHHQSLTGVTALKFSPNGRELACGMQSGALWFLHPDTLDAELEIPFKHSSRSLLDIVFSENSDYMAYRDDGTAVGAYHYIEPHEAEDISGGWKFVGKLHSHFLPIREVLFGPPYSGSSVPRLFSISEDRNLIEYDLETSGPYPEPGLKISKTVRVEHSAVPLSLSWYPKFEVERFFVFSNTEYKFKLLNDCTKLIQGTYLGPTFGSPVNRIAFLPMRNMHNQAYLVFSTNTQIGLQLLPFDGNPFEIVGIVGHPKMITRICTSFCGGYLFTLGYNDPCVLMWKIYPRAVDVMAKLGGQSLSPFYCMIDGGQEGWLLNEMQDLFYYAQILHQGENTTASRIVTDKVPIAQLPNLMRAVGYYPDSNELEELMTEVVFKNYAKTGQLVEEITFEEFVKLYVNYRPVFGLSMEHVRKSFAAFCETEMENDPVITREKFIEILTTLGDRMTVSQAHDTLRLLMPQEERENKAVDLSFSFLPADISYKDFAVGILGIEPVEEMNSSSPGKDIPQTH